MACRKKSTDSTREESIIEDTKSTLSLRTLKRTISLKNLKRTLSLWNLKRTLRGPSGDSEPSRLLCRKKLFFSFWYWYMIDWVIRINIHMKLLVLKGISFMLPVTSKLKLADFSCYSWIPWYLSIMAFLKSWIVTQIFSISNNVSYLVQETFLHHNIETF